MKTLFTIIAFIFVSAFVSAQVPPKMTYQSVIRNTSGNLVTTAPIGMQISILQSSAVGTAVYVETQIPTSNANGLVSIEVGGGTVVSGNFSTIDWGAGPYFIKTEADPAGGSTYTITGTSQLLSVPYALYSEHTRDTCEWIKNGPDTIYTLKSVGIGTSTPCCGARLEVIGESRFIGNDVNIINGNLIMTEGDSINVFGTTWLRKNIMATGYDAGILRDYLSIGIPGSSGADYRLLDGNVGIGIATPARALHVSDVMRLEPRSTAPSSPAEGDMYMDGTIHKLMVFDGTTWQACW